MSCKTIEEFKADLLNLEKQVIAVQGAMQYIGQQIASLEQKQKEEKKMNQKEE